MTDIPLGVLIAILILLIIISGFFSGSETGLMSLNRYRLKHLAENKKSGAYHAFRLLQKPDHLISLILLGNNFVNILITQLATFIGYKVYGDAGIAVATGVLTILLLIFAEVTPKTIAALHPEKIAFPAAYIYNVLIKLLYPLVITINWMASHITVFFKKEAQSESSDAMNIDELRVAVQEASGLIPDSHKDMLIGILDLEKITVDDIMVHRNDIAGIDISLKWEETVEHIKKLPYTRIPVYDGSIDKLIGVAVMRKILPFIMSNEFNLETLQNIHRPPYFIPEGTPLTTQLINFQKNKRRIGFIVDEYGDIQGLVTLADILEEIVGEFTTDPTAFKHEFFLDNEGNYIIDGSYSIRQINRHLNIELPIDGPKTLNGLILEHLQSIPQTGTSIKINRYPMEILQVKNNIAKSIRLKPVQLKSSPPHE